MIQSQVSSDHFFILANTDQLRDSVDVDWICNTVNDVG